MALFERDMQYDDDGAAMVKLYSHNYFLEKGEYSEALDAVRSKSSITNMYDDDGTTVYFTCGGTIATVTLQWDFQEKVRFLNIYVVPTVDVGVGSNNTTKIYGSNNGTDWTEEASVLQTASGSATVFCTDVTYRYIKVTQQKSAATGNMGISAVIGVKA